MKGQQTLFSGSSDEWSTPEETFQALDTEFHFTLDPCATDQNHKCALYYTQKENGLLQNWGGQSVFCNPPYSQIGAWVEKAYREASKDHTLVVLLIPSRTDTKYFHDFIYQRSEIRFVRGRLKFGEAIHNAPFPSMIVIFRGAYT